MRAYEISHFLAREVVALEGVPERGLQVSKAAMWSSTDCYAETHHLHCLRRSSQALQYYLSLERRSEGQGSADLQVGR